MAVLAKVRGTERCNRTLSRAVVAKCRNLNPSGESLREHATLPRSELLVVQPAANLAYHCTITTRFWFNIKQINLFGTLHALPSSYTY
ncbi:hypothetical protein CRG98_030353 [Punica granatum]|uniref:Uncharacterized protein n=1 Tax=Punica granatum TaxID=22663 RepID=A0A2I0IZ35_PUNGR|nr:hypothetical protein CRG98_030353 [Punica granatum]